VPDLDLVLDCVEGEEEGAAVVIEELDAHMSELVSALVEDLEAVEAKALHVGRVVQVEARTRRPVPTLHTSATTQHSTRDKVT
jgi:hypothetical protein